jgi:hypothetical protein
MVNCPGEYSSTLEGFERYVQSEKTRFGTVPNGFSGRVVWIPSTFTNFTLVPKYQLQIVELDDVPNRVSPNK